MGDTSMDQRFIDMQAELALQKHTVDQLSDVVAAQQEQIDRLELKVDALIKKLRAFNDLLSYGGVDDGPPPHY